VYGPLLVLGVAGILALLHRWRVAVDEAFLLALLPFAILGPAWSALEATGAFCRAGAVQGCAPGLLAWASVVPLTFASVLLAAIACTALGAVLRDRALPPRQEVGAFLAIALLAALAYLAAAALAPSGASQWASPLAALGSAAVATLAFALLRRARVPPLPAALAAGGLLLLLPALAMVAEHLGAGARPGPLGLVVGAALAIAAGSALLGRLGQRRGIPHVAPFAVAINVAVVFGHALDGTTTFAAVCSDPAGVCGGAAGLGLGLPAYHEQQPASLWLLGLADGWAFPVLKVALAAGVVYALDVVYRRDLAQDPALAGLVKFAVLVFGLAPGARNALRLLVGA
jgi:uncharacterized membrane protein